LSGILKQKVLMQAPQDKSDPFFHSFSEMELELPDKFTFPFYYEPHPLAIQAANELQHYLKTQHDFEHNFGLIDGQKGIVIGKMFGVLVVRDQEGRLGHLWAVSGKLADSNVHRVFVPPVFDILTDVSFYREEESNITAINSRIAEMEKNPLFNKLNAELHEQERQAKEELESIKQKIKAGKALRKIQRYEAASMEALSRENLLEELRKASIKEQYFLKERTLFWRKENETLKSTLLELQNGLNSLYEDRKQRSSALQQKIFRAYTFLNREKEERSLEAIFEKTAEGRPPAGAGECAAPKLLQHAFLNNYEPIAMAEFWWGASPASEVRKHGNYYPACRGKCEPILGHMLRGIETDPNPMLTNPAEGRELNVIYEDDHLLLINKPEEFLSVPGKNITDSVYTRIRELYPAASGPLIVHRLDMSTSGLLLIAKSEMIYKTLQRQFLKRTVKKRYVAILSGVPKEQSGEIDLPLRVDLEDRPRQLVCYQHGRPARTKWELVEQQNDKSKVYFYPITGRTHQLRVHAAHSLGLNCSIVGDDIYGEKANRLHLHAEQLTFFHPVKKKEMTFVAECPF
jgi:tRNA pseudouridine32 synthase / 23S rRNA pseudouridine746 synthase